MKLSDAFDVLARMSTVKRYSQTTLINPESVLEHTGFVALLCYMIEPNDPVVLQKALCHDIDEIITGDIPRPAKYYNEGVKEALQEVADDNMDIIARKLDRIDLYFDWKGSKHDKSGFIVELADKLAVVYKLHQEVIMHGNKTLVGHAELVKNALIKMSGEYKELDEYINQGIIICEGIEDYE